MVPVKRAFGRAEGSTIIDHEDSLGGPGVQSADVPRASSTTPSYQMTRWPAVNSLLGVVERLTRGRAGWLQRLVSYLFFGGTAALVNIGVFVGVLRLALPFSDVAHNLTAFLVAAEVSTMVNFLLNDAVTFRHLSGHGRSWLARCARFHATCVVGTILAYVVQGVLHFALGVPSLVAEAVAIALITGFNFASHHVFTYRAMRATVPTTQH